MDSYLVIRRYYDRFIFALGEISAGRNEMEREDTGVSHGGGNAVNSLFVFLVDHVFASLRGRFPYKKYYMFFSFEFFFCSIECSPNFWTELGLARGQEFSKVLP